jgi:hypothetical protein
MTGKNSHQVELGMTSPTTMTAAMTVTHTGNAVATVLVMPPW